MQNQINLNRKIEKVPFLEFLKIIQRKKFFFIAFTVISIFLGILFAFTANPIYQTEAYIIIGTKTPQMVTKEEFSPLGPKRMDYYKTIHRMLRSPSLAKEVIQKLQLEDNEEFTKSYSPLSLKNLIPFDASAIKLGLQSFLAKLGLKSKNPEADNAISNPYPPLIRKFLSKLIVSPISESHLVKIGFQGYSPPMITKITNTLIDDFILRNNQLRKSILGQSGNWMEFRLKELKEKERISELAMQEFIRKNDIVEFKNDRDATYLNMQKYFDGVRAAERETLEAKALLKQLESLEGSPIEKVLGIPDSLKTTAVTQLIEEYTQVSSEQKIASQNYKALHPKMIPIQERLNQVEEKFPEELKRFKKVMETTFKSLAENEQLQRESLEKQKTLVMEMDGIEIEYQKLKNDLDTNKNFHTEFLKRYKEVKLSSLSTESDIQVLDRPETPDLPIKPNKRVIVFLSLAFGVLGGSIFSIFVDSIKRTIHSSYEIEEECEFPLLGSIGIYDPEKGRLPVLDMSSCLAEDFRILKTRLDLTVNKKRNRVSLITSVTPGQGKTTLVSNLSVSYAQANKKVLVIDADFLIPIIHTVFQIENKPGLMEIFNGNKKPKEVIHTTKYDGVFAIPRGSLEFNGSKEYFDPKLFKKLIQTVKKDFDFVFVDSPPIMASHLATLLAHPCDEVIIVIKTGSENMAQTKKAINEFHLDTQNSSNGNGITSQNYLRSLNSSKHGASKISGLVLNGVKNERQYYYSYYKKM